MNDSLTLYQCADIIQQIEDLAVQNDGEVPEDKLEALVQAHTTAMSKLQGLCGYMAHLSGGIDLCRQEEQRIAAMRKRAENRLESIKKFLLPFVSQHKKEKGYPLAVGTFVLSTRKSESVEVDAERFFSVPANKDNLSRHKESWEPDKTAIKEAIKAGEEVVGARLVPNESLQVK